MLLSVSLILMVGMFMGWLCQKCRLPSLLGMLATGMVLGPYVLNCGMGMSWICKKLKLPGLLGMLLTGIVLGPYVLNLLDENLLNISSELRKMALIIILMRAGLGLDISGLKKSGVRR